MVAWHPHVVLCSYTLKVICRRFSTNTLRRFGCLTIPSEYDVSTSKADLASWARNATLPTTRCAAGSPLHGKAGTGLPHLPRAASSRPTCEVGCSTATCTCPIGACMRREHTPICIRKRSSIVGSQSKGNGPTAHVCISLPAARCLKCTRAHGIRAEVEHPRPRGEVGTCRLLSPFSLWLTHAWCALRMMCPGASSGMRPSAA
jgi:hypothetical protein